MRTPVGPRLGKGRRVLSSGSDLLLPLLSPSSPNSSFIPDLESHQLDLEPSRPSAATSLCDLKREPEPL